MQFKSLNDAFSNNFIKSLPHLTRLDLTANEIKIIELVLSFTHKGLHFYMNHSTIAEYLVLGQTKTKAKSVGNIIAKLKKKGYVSTITSHNFNGKNGGSSTTITVNETLLEAQLHAVFNPNVVSDPIQPQAPQIEEAEPKTLGNPEPTSPSLAVAESVSPNAKTSEQTAAEFIAELEAMDDEPRPIADLPHLRIESQQPDDEVVSERINPAERVLLQTDYSNMNEATFKAHLQKLIRLNCMTLNRTALQTLIDNRDNWKLEYCKGGLGYLIEGIE